MPTIKIAIDSTKAKSGAAEVKESLRQVSDQARRADDEIEDLEDEMDDLGKTSSGAGRSLRQAAASISLLAGGYSAIQGLREAISTISEYELSLAQTAAVARATASDFQALTDITRELGAYTQFSAKQAADGARFLAMAGFDMHSVISALPATLDLALAGMLDLGEAADYASNLVSQFGLSAADTTRVVDTMVNTANRSNTNVRQLAEGMKFAGPFARSLGVSIEETAAMMGVLGNNGIQASLAGTNLRGIMARLINPVAAAKEAFQRLGVTLEEMDPLTNNLVDIFARLKDAGAGPKELLQIFSRLQVSAAVALTASSESTKAMLATYADAEGVARRYAETIQSTLWGRFKEFTSVLQEVILEIGDQGVLGAMKNILQFGTSVARALLGMADSGDKFGGAAQFVARSIVFASSALTAFVGIQLAGWALSSAAAMLTLSLSVKAVWAAISAHPLGALATGIGLAVTALYTFKDELITVGDTQATVGEFMYATWIVLTKRMYEAWDILRQSIGTGLEWWRDMFKLAYEWIHDNFGDTLSSMWGGIKRWFDDTWAGAKVLVNGAIAIVKAFGAFFEAEFQRLSDAANVLLNIDLTKPEQAWTKFKEGMAILTDPTQGITKFKETFKTEMAKNNIEDGVEIGANYLKGVLEGLTDWAGVDWDDYAEQFSHFFGSGLVADIKTEAQRLADERLRLQASVSESMGGGPRVEVPFIPEELEQASQQLDEMLDRIRFERSLIGLTNDARERAILLRQAEQAAIADGLPLTDERIQQYVTEARELQVLQEQIKEAESFGQQFGDTVSDSLLDIAIGAKSAEDALADLAKVLARMILQKAVFDQLGNAIASGVTSMMMPKTTPTTSGSIGNISDNITSYDFSGTAVSARGDFFTTRSKAILGESGPEAIMPLTRGASGELGVKMVSAPASERAVNFEPTIEVTVPPPMQRAQAVQAPTVTVTVVNQTSGRAEVQETKRSDGSRDIMVTLMEAVAKDIRGRGEVGRAMEEVTGTRRRGISH